MSPMDSLLSSVDWKAEADPPSREADLPYVTHSGVLQIGDLKLRCYRLNDGRAIFDAEDVHAFFGYFAA